MIKTKNLVPDIYYDQSRDFQFLGRTLEVVFNYLKTNIDLVKENPVSKNSSEKMVNLLSKTVGFDTKHLYSTQDLKAICEVFSDLVRKKGSKEAIENACKTLMSVQNVGGDPRVVEAKDENLNRLYMLNIYVPSDLKDIVLLEDLFNYILPAGYDYRFIRGVESDARISSIGFTQSVNNFVLPKANTTLIANPNVRDSRPDLEEPSNSEKFSDTFTSTIYQDFTPIGYHEVRITGTNDTVGLKFYDGQDNTGTYLGDVILSGKKYSNYSGWVYVEGNNRTGFATTAASTVANVNPKEITDNISLYVTQHPERTFYIDNVAYTMYMPMTWLEWVNSDYNTAGFTCASASSNVYTSDGTKIVVQGSAQQKGSYSVVPVRYTTTSE